MLDPAYWGCLLRHRTLPGRESGNNHFRLHILPAGSLSPRVFQRRPSTSVTSTDGSGPENFTLQRMAARAGIPVAAIALWLSAFYVSGTTPSDFLQSNMPEYTWYNATKIYKFDGASVQSNPNLGVWITTNQDIYHLTCTWRHRLCRLRVCSAGSGARLAAADGQRHRWARRPDPEAPYWMSRELASFND